MSGVFGGPPKSSTTTTVQNVPDFVKPFFQTGLNSAQSLLQGPGPQFFPGNQVAPLNPVQEQGLSSTINTANAVNPAASAANQLAATENGAFLSPQSNPFLDQTFQHAADLTQNRLASEFAGQGRDLSGSLPVRSDTLTNLANSIFGQNFQDERQRQIQASAFAPSVESGQFIPSQQLLGIGGGLQNQTQNLINQNVNAFDYQQQLPYNQLSFFTNQLAQNGQPFRSGSTTTPIFSNPFQTALGGASAGAGLGSSLFSGNPIAAGTGAVLGGLLGFL